MTSVIYESWWLRFPTFWWVIVALKQVSVIFYIFENCIDCSTIPILEAMYVKWSCSAKMILCYHILDSNDSLSGIALVMHFLSSPGPRLRDPLSWEPTDFRSDSFGPPLSHPHPYSWLLWPHPAINSLKAGRAGGGGGGPGKKTRMSFDCFGVTSCSHVAIFFPPPPPLGASWES